MNHTKDKDYALQNIKSLSDVFHQEIIDRSEAIANYGLWGMILLVPAVAYIGGDSNVLRESFSNIQSTIGHFGANIIVQMPLAAIFGLYAKVTFDDYWSKQNRKFLSNERFRLQHEDDDIVDYPVYSQENVRKIVKSKLEQETQSSYPAFKKLYMDGWREDILGMIKPHIVMTAFFAFSFTMVNYALFTSEPNENQVNNNSQTHTLSP